MGLKKIHATTTHEFGLNACCATFKFNSKLGNLTSRNPTISNIIWWVARSMGWSSHRPSVWCSKCYFFHSFYKILCKILLIVFTIIFFITLQKKLIKSFESKPLFYFQSIKIILGPSDAWSMRGLTQRPSVFIEDCGILCIVPLSILQYLYAHSLKSASLRIRYKAYRLPKKVFKRIFFMQK